MRQLPFLGLLLCAASLATAQVTVRLKNGQKFVGEAILKEDDEKIEVKVCHSYSRVVPKSAVEGYDLPTPWEARPPRAATQPAAVENLTAQEHAHRRQLIADYFDRPEQRERMLAEIRRRDALPRRDVEPYLATILAAARRGPRLRVGDFVFDHPRYRGNVHVEVHPRPTTSASAPASSSATRPADEPYALVVLLHGGGQGSGDWRAGAGMFMGGFRRHLGRVVFLCPVVLEKKYAEWGGNPDEEDYVKELIKAAKRTWAIDTNRVYCAGYSMGGYGTWHIGGHQADVFAGLVSGAGGILLGMRRGETWGWGILSNLAHTPIFFAHARDDVPAPVWSDQEADRILTELGQRRPGTYRHKYVEYEKGGHGAAERGMGEGIAFAAANRRGPDPRFVVWEPSRSFIRHFYWLRVEQPRFFTRIEAAIDGNTIDLKLTGIAGGFSILLNERLVDMQRPLIVRCDGKVVFEGMVVPSLSALLQSLEDKLDPRMCYWGRIDF